MRPVQKISDILAKKRPAFSFEVFPPRTDGGMAALYEAIARLAEMGPDYISVTYGAGGSTRGRTREIAREAQRRFGLPAMHHLTLVNQTKDELSAIIQQIRDDGLRNILALRGDPPPEMGGRFERIEGGLEFCHELLDLIRKIGGDHFSLGVAGFPDAHPDSPSRELDTAYLKQKIDHGAEFVVTQFFFENEVYSQYLERTAKAGINVPILPGVLPITDYDKLLDFSRKCGAYICDLVHETFAPIRREPELLLKQGLEYALSQCEDLLRRGAPGLHFYCLNKVEPARTIMQRLRAVSTR